MSNIFEEYPINRIIQSQGQIDLHNDTIHDAGQQLRGVNEMVSSGEVSEGEVADFYRDALNEIILENTDLLEFLSSKTTLKDAEKEKRIDEFLSEKFSADENEKWQNESQFFTHFRNWFLKKNSEKKIENNSKKAERR